MSVWHAHDSDHVMWLTTCFACIAAAAFHCTQSAGGQAAAGGGRAVPDAAILSSYAGQLLHGENRRLAARVAELERSLEDERRTTAAEAAGRAAAQQELHDFKGAARQAAHEAAAQVQAAFRSIHDAVR